MTTIIEREDIFPLLTGRTPVGINRLLGYYLKEANIPLSKEQWSIMAVLWKNDGCTQQVLADATFRDRPGTTRLLDFLEKEGLVKRRENKADRRTNLIYLTAKGAALEKPVFQALKKTIETATRGISQDELQTIRKTFARIHKNIKEIELNR